MKILKFEEPKNIFGRLKETLYTTRRKALIGKFFNNWRGKVGKRSIEQRIDLMNGFQNMWLFMG